MINRQLTLAVAWMIDYYGCMKKECSKCGEVKAFSEYYKHKGYKHGLKSNCKACVKEYYKQWRQANKKAIAKKDKQYYQANKEAIAEKGKQYREANKEARAESQKQWQKANKEARAEYQKQWRQANKKAIAKKDKQYREANKEARAEKKKHYMRKRRAKDPAFRMIDSLRSGLWQAMDGTRKPKRTMELLGCSRKQLRKHLSAQFTEGMTLENYGADGWVIDHIIPVSHFDHKDQKQVEVCWHYTNMQPLWDRDNLIKSDMLPHEWEAFKASGTTMESCPS